MNSRIIKEDLMENDDLRARLEQLKDEANNLVLAAQSETGDHFERLFIARQLKEELDNLHNRIKLASGGELAELWQAAADDLESLLSPADTSLSG
jgi:hypothetical protein